MGNWTESDEFRVNLIAYSDLIKRRDDYIRILGKERYDRSVSEFRLRLGIAAPEYGHEVKNKED